MSQKSIRRYIRFKPDEGTIGFLDLNMDPSQLSPTIAALVIDESSHGCGVAVLEDHRLRVGVEVVAQIGKLSPTRCVIRWKIGLDTEVAKIGLEYLPKNS